MRSKLLEKSGWPKDFLAKLPLYASVYTTGHKRLLRPPLLLIKKMLFAVMRRLGRGMPTVAGAETWAFKNTMLAVQVIRRRTRVSSPSFKGAPGFISPLDNSVHAPSARLQHRPCGLGRPMSLHDHALALPRPDLSMKE